MSTALPTCGTPGCAKLTMYTVPCPRGRTRKLSPANARKYCSIACARKDLTDRITCQKDGCARLCRNATPSFSSPQTALPELDTKKYCSKDCADLITCEVCAERKPPTAYIRYVGTSWIPTIPIPIDCELHVVYAPHDTFSASICIACLTQHITTRFQDRGFSGINCISPQCNYNASGDWRTYALQFLPLDQHQAFFQQSIDAFMKTTETWTCPNGCTSPQWTLDARHTPGYPQVECPDCTGRFCACCKVGWHEDLTCQEYRSIHPELRDEEEVAHLVAMAKLGARRCPSCCWIIVKDGGCTHMICERCYHEFDWRSAEKIRPPKDSVAKSEEADPSPPSPAQLLSAVILPELRLDEGRPGEVSTVFELNIRPREARTAYEAATWDANETEALEDDDRELKSDLVTCEMDAISRKEHRVQK